MFFQRASASTQSGKGCYRTGWDRDTYLETIWRTALLRAPSIAAKARTLGGTIWRGKRSRSLGERLSVDPIKEWSLPSPSLTATGNPHRPEPSRLGR